MSSNDGAQRSSKVRALFNKRARSFGVTKNSSIRRDTEETEISRVSTFKIENKPESGTRRFSCNADHGALFINSKAGVAGTREWQCHAKVSATEHRIVERIFGSFFPLPLSFQPPTLPVALSLSLGIRFSVYHVRFPILFSFYSFSPSVSLFFLFVVPRVPRSLCFSPFPPIGPRRTIRPSSVVAQALSASLPSYSVSRYLTGWLALSIVSLACFG